MVMPAPRGGGLRNEEVVDARWLTCVGFAGMEATVGRDDAVADAVEGTALLMLGLGL